MRVAVGFDRDLRTPSLSMAELWILKQINAKRQEPAATS